MFKKLCPLACSILSPGCRTEAAGPSCCTHVGGFEGVPLTADAAGDTEAQAGVFLYPHTQLLLEAVGALLALRLQKTASALGSWVGVGRHNNLITVDHALVAVDDVLVAVGDALVAVVLRVGGGLVRGERRLVS